MQSMQVASSPWSRCTAKIGVREDLVGGADHGLEHPLVGVGAGALGELDDERRLAVHVAPEQAHGLLEVVDVVGADGVLAVGVLEQFLGRNDHGGVSLGSRLKGPVVYGLARARQMSAGTYPRKSALVPSGSPRHRR